MPSPPTPTILLRAGSSLPAADWSAALERVLAASGERLFPALTRLAAFVAAAPAPGVVTGDAAPPKDPLSLPGPARHAFVLTVRADMLNPDALFDRVRGALQMPSALAFVHVYRSRLLGRVVSMGQIYDHRGRLPPAGEARLLAFLREELRDGEILRASPSYTAGVTRLLLQVDAALYLTRAAAGDAPLSPDHVERGLTLARGLGVHVASGLPERWSDPEVARVAAYLFAPR